MAPAEPVVSSGPDSPRVLVVGEAVVDVLNQPGVDQKRLGGGGPSNVALGLGRLRVPTDLLTHIAPDDDGMILLYRLIDAGVSLVPGSFSALRTPTAEATVDDSGQPIYRFDITWSLPAVDFIRIPDLLHVGSYSAFMEPGADRIRDLALRARQEGAMVSFDPNIRPALLEDHANALARFEEIASVSTLVKLSDEDARWLYPTLEVSDVIDRLTEFGVKLMAVTLGANGSVIATPSIAMNIPIARGKVTDAIGAGDSYMAALIQCVFHADLDHPVPDEIEWIGHRCAAAAAITVSRPGADPPWLSELTGWLVRWE
jgi:fructokinase